MSPPKRANEARHLGGLLEQRANFLALQKPRPPLGGVGRREDRDVPVNQKLHPRDGALATFYDHLSAIDAEAAFLDRFKVVPVVAFLPAHIL